MPVGQERPQLVSDGASSLTPVPPSPSCHVTRRASLIGSINGVPWAALPSTLGRGSRPTCRRDRNWLLGIPATWVEPHRDARQNRLPA